MHGLTPNALGIGSDIDREGSPRQRATDGLVKGPRQFAGANHTPSFTDDGSDRSEQPLYVYHEIFRLSCRLRDQNFRHQAFE